MSGIVGRPTAGVRFVLDRVAAAEDASPPGQVLYRGFAHLPSADLPLEVRVAADGACTGDAGDPALAKQAAALVRAAVKAPLAAGRPPPRRIVRWRQD